MKMNELVTIGKITKHQGNKGEVKVLPLTDFPERFEYLNEVYLCKKENICNFQIENIRYHKNFIILKFVGIDNIAEAINIKDYFIKIPEEKLIALREDEFYIFELINYKVYLKEGKFLGHVSDIRKTGGTDIFIVSGKNKDYMLPAAREFLTIEEKEEKIIVTPIPGLLEI